jgi:GNAT superfamily N-acetyltransferase
MKLHELQDPVAAAKEMEDLNAQMVAATGEYRALRTPEALRKVTDLNKKIQSILAARGKAYKAIFEDFADNGIFALYDALDKLGVDAFVSERKGVITLSKIVVKKEARNQGTGTKAMELITKYADKRGLVLALTPTNDFGGTKTRLMQFYKRFGFVENKGRDRDPNTKETMVRRPE